MLKIARSYLHSSEQNTETWRTDRRRPTERQTDLPWLLQRSALQAMRTRCKIQKKTQSQADIKRVKSTFEICDSWRCDRQKVKAFVERFIKNFNQSNRSQAISRSLCILFLFLFIFSYVIILLRLVAVCRPELKSWLIDWLIDCQTDERTIRLFILYSAILTAVNATKLFSCTAVRR